MPEIDALIAESVRTACKVRLHLRAMPGESRAPRSIEGRVLEISAGRDGRARLRVGIPTGSGEPVEIRVLRESIERAEMVDAPTERHSTGARPIVRKQTLPYGLDGNAIRRASGTSEAAAQAPKPLPTPGGPRRS